MAYKTSLLRSLLSVSAMTLLSRIVGFLRDVVMANVFGAGIAMDAFVVAFRLPNLLRRIFAEGAFSQAFVPVLAEFKASRSSIETQDFIASVAGLLTLVLLIITAFGILCAGVVIMLTAPGFIHYPAKYELTVHLLRITFPYIIFISLASLVGGILNTWGKFTVPAITPIILNIVWIIAVLCFRHYFNPQICVVAWAILVGGILQLTFQLPFLKHIGIRPILKFNLKNKAVTRVVRLMGPAVFATSIAQISMVINTIFASLLPNGSLSWMYFADRLMEFPTSILGTALATILLPSLAKHATNNDHQSFSQTLDWGLRLCLLMGVPATIGLAIIAKPLIMTLFMHGKFTLFDVAMTRRALIAYAVGLLGLILVKIFAPGFYARQDIKTPVKIAIGVLIATQIMNIIFIGPFKHAGLALAIGLGACINAACLGYLLIKRGIYKPQPGLALFLFKLLIAIIVMVIALLLALHYVPFNFIGHILVRVLSLFALLTIAVISYFSGLYLLGFRLKHFNVLTH